MDTRKDLHSAFHQNWQWFLLWGILFIVLGVIAISATFLTTIITVVFLGALIFVAGIVNLIDTFSYWRGKWGGFVLHLVMSILYLLVGIMLVTNPVAASISLTLLLGLLYLILGIFRLIYSLSLRIPRWGWGVASGIITILLGLLILASWPASSLFIIGLFVGIDLLFWGWAYVMAALSTQHA